MKNQIAAIKLFKKISMYMNVSQFGIYTPGGVISFRADIDGLDDGSLSIDRIDIPDNSWIDRVEGHEVVFVNALGIETRIKATRSESRQEIPLRDSAALTKDEKSKIKWLVDACASPDRPNIASIALSPKHGFVTTDGHRLHSWRPDFAVSCHEETKTVSPDILLVLKKPEKFELTADGIYAESSDGLCGFFPWLDLKYPDIDQLFRRFSDGSVSFEVDEWEPKKDKEKIKSAVKINGAKGQAPIVFHLDRTEFSKEKIGHFFKASGVGLNPKYLDRVAGDYSSSWSVMSSCNKYPIFFRSDDRKALVMPLRQ
jgi:hypothetical protein